MVLDSFFPNDLLLFLILMWNCCFYLISFTVYCRAISIVEISSHSVFCGSMYIEDWGELFSSFSFWLNLFHWFGFFSSPFVSIHYIFYFDCNLCFRSCMYVWEFVLISFDILKLGEFTQIDSVCVSSLHMFLIFYFDFLHFWIVDMWLTVPLCTNNFRKSNILWSCFSLSSKPHERHFTSILLGTFFCRSHFKFLWIRTFNHHVSNYYLFIEYLLMNAII